MSARTQVASITRTTVETALRDARNGAVYDRLDPACKGLQMRVSPRAVTWTMRARFGGSNRRWTIGRAIAEPPRGCDPGVREMWAAQHVSADEARRRAFRVRDMVENGADPTLKVQSWITGVMVERLYAQEELKGPKSITWEASKTLFLDHIKAKKSVSTFDDYSYILHKTPELEVLKGRKVASITEEDIAEIIAKIHRRKEPHSEHVLRILSSMWTHLALAENRRQTSVQKFLLRGLKAPDRTPAKLGAKKNPKDIPPTLLQLGRTVAVARTGALGVRASAAVLLLCGSAQRRRPVAASRYFDFKDMDEEIVWEMPPYFRKPSKKKRSSSIHPVPLVGFAAEAVRVLREEVGEGDWFLPVARPRRAGTKPKAEHSPADYINGLLDRIPGGVNNPHQIRAAIATFGPIHLGWGQHDSKVILDHLEGFDGNDVTAQHYNSDPQMLLKRKMMREWTAWLDKLADDAVAADKTLLDREALREVIYRMENGEAAWKAAIEKAHGRALPWSDTAIAERQERAAKRRRERAALRAAGAAAVAEARQFLEAAE